MASIFSVLSGATEAVSALSSLAFGASGGVVLGEFVFSGFEVPEYITIGGSQAMTVHRLPGGERVIDVMGDEPADISWCGTIIDGDPYGRARELDQIRSVGAPLALHWGSFLYTVIVRTFSAQTLYGRVQYSISCAVLRNEATAPPSAAPLLTDVVGADMASALASAPAAVSGVLTTAQTAVAAIGRLIPGSPSLAIAAASLGSANASLQSLNASAGAAITAISGATSLASITSAAGSVAQSLQSAAYVGRAIRNLT